MKDLVACVFVLAVLWAFDSCSGFFASHSDWLIAQYANDGHVVRCWQLKNTSIVNEDHGGMGIHWRARDGHYTHLSGWYACAEVQRHDFERAAKELGVNDTTECNGGRLADQLPANPKEGDSAAIELPNGKRVRAIFHGSEWQERRAEPKSGDEVPPDMMP